MAVKRAAGPGARAKRPRAGSKPPPRKRVGQGKGGGRPTPYKPEYAHVAAAMFRLGATDREVAEALKIDVRTYYRWRLEYPKFCQSSKIGKVPANERVKAAFYSRCVGYSYDSEEIRIVNGSIRRVKTVTHVPPDVKAGSIWLYNRDPENWRERMQVSTPPGQPFEVDMKLVPGNQELRDEYQRRLAAIAADGAADSAPGGVGVARESGEEPQG